VILAGGITPDTVAELVKSTEAEWIDLMTGVEISPGIKDAEKVKALFDALRYVPN
jgi:phosphoribosylanthranilate isomerase